MLLEFDMKADQAKPLWEGRIDKITYLEHLKLRPETEVLFLSGSETLIAP